MSTERAETAMKDSLGGIEQSLIEEFVRARGHDPDNLNALSEVDRDALLKDASVYASGKLTEIESRAHFVQELHNRVGGATKIGLD